MKAAKYWTLLLFIAWHGVTFAGTTGKIAGTVVDTRTREPLAGANVVIEGQAIGAPTNADGYFVLLNIPPGTYRVRVSLIGYAPKVYAVVRVNIDETTTLNAELQEQTTEAQEILVVAPRPVVRRDVSASTANVQIQDVEKLPVTNVTQAVALQAGIQPGLIIRGGNADETVVLLDGFALRDDRTNGSFTGLNLSSVQDVQVQTGGFNAEYGNIRSGVVNVVTKEGGKSNYSFSLVSRYSPTSPKHFGPSVYDANSFWIRPYLDPAVCWDGTASGAWDEYTQRQYASFAGYNAVSAATLKNADPSKQLSPEAARDLFLFEHRKQAEVLHPDWEYDMGFGGPVPFAGEALGNLRFFASYRALNSMYIIPLSTASYREYNGQFKLVGDLTSAMKLTGSFLMARTSGTNNNNGGAPGLFVSPSDVANLLGSPSSLNYIDTRIFATDYWAPSTVDYVMAGLKISHALSVTTFYDASVTYFHSSYDTRPGTARNLAKTYLFGNGYYADEAPWGFTPTPNPSGSPVSTIRYGLGFSDSRDSSRVGVITGKFDLTSQLDRYNLVQAGLELTYTDNHTAYGIYDQGLLRNSTTSSWASFPWRGSAYAQDKLEFAGMVANLGVRLDVLDPNGKWYSFADPYSKAFTAAYAGGTDTLLAMSTIKPIVTLSPRLGISFPVSDVSKIYFNYGHFRQIPSPENLFLLRRSAYDNSIVRIADPSAPFPKTVAYELGYEHSFFDEYLVRVAGYYKDISDESFLVTYNNSDASVSYSKYTSNAFRDIRGFEATISKNGGDWVRGFLNYTYDVRASGYFGAAIQYSVASTQEDYISQNVYPTKPIPRPYARMNVDVFTPADFGPELLGTHLLGDWRVNFLGSWSSGFYFTWIGGGSKVGVQNNLQWQDSWNLDMRISKGFTIGKMNLQLFADITNLFNLRYMTQYGFSDFNDYRYYMQSLHLPASVARDFNYLNVPGSDVPGNYRKDGVDFQPIEVVTQFTELSLAANQKTRPFYYVLEQNQYYQLVNGSWQTVDPARLDQVMKDKAYIDMPNQSTFTFLNPRNVFYGIRLSFDL